MSLNVVAKNKISVKELKRFLYPTEGTWFLVALIGAVPVFLLIMVMMYYNFLGTVIFLGMLVFVFWFVYAMARANLVTNSVRVSSKNFPAVQKVVEEVKEQLGFNKSIEVFVVEEGSVNAFVANFFRRRFIILNSGLVEKMLSDEKKPQLKWIIARFVGALKVKHFRFIPLKILIDAIGSINGFNFFILPYDRACQYSGDNIGLIVCGNLKMAMEAFDKFLVGNNLAKYVSLAGMIDQSKDSQGDFFVAMARFFSAYPHITDRYLNMLIFSRWKYPEQFKEYISGLDRETVKDLAQILPDYYSDIAHTETPIRVSINLNPSSDIKKRIKITKRS